MYNHLFLRGYDVLESLHLGIFLNKMIFSVSIFGILLRSLLIVEFIFYLYFFFQFISYINIKSKWISLMVTN